MQTRVKASQPTEAAAARPGPPGVHIRRGEVEHGTRPGRIVGLYPLLHLAAALTEAVGVQDVVDQLADQLLDAFNAQGLVLFATANDRLRVIGYRGYTAEIINQFDGAALSGPPTPSRLALIGCDVLERPPAGRSPPQRDRVGPELRTVLRGPCHRGLHLPGSTKSIVRCVHTTGITSIDGWVHAYNHQRPHQALNMATPISLYCSPHPR
ncbi:integrase core domain-containing protein [Streptomyces fagopyri]